MSYRRYHTDELVALSRDAIHAFTERDIERFSAYLDEDFSFAADDAPLFIRGKAAFLESIRAEQALPPVTICDEDYTLLCRDVHLWAVFGRFTAYAGSASSMVRFTFLWRQNRDEMRLLHADAVHVRPVPPELLATAPDTAAAQAHLFDPPAVRAAIGGMNGAPPPKYAYRDIEGHSRFVSDIELLYVERVGANARFHAAGGAVFDVRISLDALERPGLARIHRTYLVNLSYIRELCRYRATLLDGTELPVGKERFMELRQKLQP